ELDELRNTVEAQKWLINEANLIFYIDKDQMDSNTFIPYRLYLFDANNAVPISDYSNDATTASGQPKFNKYIYGGILEKDENGKGYRYKFRVTKHIENLLMNSEAKNVKFGVSVSESISQVSMISLFSASGEPTDSP